jgi:hypothetical protein
MVNEMYPNRKSKRGRKGMKAARIEDQIHQFLIDQEEERCRAIEAENSKNEETKNKKVKRKAIPKPWTRPSASALCQATDLLIMVRDYDYDLSDKKFQDYCATRGILHVAGEPGSRRWKYMADFRKTKSTYLSDSYFRFAVEIDGKRHRFTDDEMETDWKIISLGRAKLQDCWELYSRELQTTKGN